MNEDEAYISTYSQKESPSKGRGSMTNGQGNLKNFNKMSIYELK
jgi:hypothetical protein